ncbi:hypothetical protein GCM10025864_35840 [Luteimicrobium album]|uniref:Uncharacterized protein n=1 Tax=Luteimicrobium album TaxID=1054550 RepID=A0ABQ6I4W5_9MICO|nr:hypothetical protein GCM10025864_34810 [Luteimicrobium album]GMA25825.1 hypothetical protein GCM10025864_35840 [Luteimicrobium album]
MASGHGLDRELAELLTGLVDRDERVGPLVDISANHDNHGGCLLHLISDWTVGPVGGHTSVGVMPRSYQVTPAGPFPPGDGKTHAGQPAGGSEPMSQSPDDKGSNHRNAAPSP